MELIEHEPQLPQLNSIPENWQQQLDQGLLIAQRYGEIIEQQGLFQKFGGQSKHITNGGWQLAGLLMGGITAREESVIRQDDGVWIAVTELVTRDGAVVGRGSGMCSPKERNWAKKDEYARRGMAVTRSNSRAYKNAFGWLVVIAGYEATPADEMPTDEKRKAAPRKPKPPEGPPAATEATLAKYEQLYQAVEQAVVDGDLNRLNNQATQLHIFADRGEITEVQLDQLQAHINRHIQAIEKELESAEELQQQDMPY